MNKFKYNVDKFSQQIQNNNKLIFHKNIYTVKDTEIYTGEYCGLKCIIKKLLLKNNSNIFSKFLREITFLKKSDHPNIIKLYDVFYKNGDLYLILEKCDESIIKNKNKIDNDKLISDIILALK